MLTLWAPNDHVIDGDAYGRHLANTVADRLLVGSISSEIFAVLSFFNKDNLEAVFCLFKGTGLYLSGDQGG